MIKSDETHCKLTLRPDDFFCLPQFRAGRQDVEVRSSAATPTLFLGRISLPTGFFETPGKFPEAVEVQCHRGVDICGESILVRKVQLVCNGADYDEVCFEFRT